MYIHISDVCINRTTTSQVHTFCASNAYTYKDLYLHVGHFNFDSRQSLGTCLYLTFLNNNTAIYIINHYNSYDSIVFVLSMIFCFCYCRFLHSQQSRTYKTKPCHLFTLFLYFLLMCVKSRISSTYRLLAVQLVNLCQCLAYFTIDGAMMFFSIFLHRRICYKRQVVIINIGYSYSGRFDKCSFFTGEIEIHLNDMYRPIVLLIK